MSKSPSTNGTKDARAMLYDLVVACRAYDSTKPAHVQEYSFALDAAEAFLQVPRPFGPEGIVDRGDAVNLASNIVSRLDTGSYDTVTDKGVKCLADAVLRMDEALRTRERGRND